MFDREATQQQLGTVDSQITALAGKIKDRRTCVELMARLRRQPVSETQDDELSRMVQSLITLRAAQDRLVLSLIRGRHV